MVDSYGAKPDGSADSTKAINDAISAAIQSGAPAQVVFSAGTYRMDCINASSGVCLFIPNAKNLILRGQGIANTQLLLSNPLFVPLALYTSADVTVRDFSIDYSSLSFTQGTVTQVNSSQRTFTVIVDSGYPSLDQPIFASNYLPQTIGMIFDASTSAVKANTDYYLIQSLAKLSNGQFQVTASSVSNIAVNDRFVLPNRTQAAMTFYRSNNVTLANVAVYAAPGAATIWAENTGRVLIDGFQVRKKPGTTRLISTTADAIHMVDNMASVTIQNCNIGGMGDDALNTRSTPFTVTSISGTTVKFDTGGKSGFAAGHTLQMVDPRTQLPKGSSTISSVSVQGTTATVTLRASIPNMAVGDVAFDMEFSSSNAIVQNNTFTPFRGMFRIRSVGAVFTNNLIMDARNSRVLISADINSSWSEGPSLVDAPGSISFSGNVIQGGALYLLGVNYQNLGSPP